MASVDVEGATICGKNKQKTNVFWRTVPQNEQFRNVLVPGVASGILKGNNNDSKLHSQGQTIRKSKSDSAVPSRRDDFLTLEKGARRTTKTTRKIPEKDSSVKTTNVLKGIGQVGSLMSLSGSENSRRSSIKNLNVEDKKRVANLIKELAKTGEERELALERLHEERVSFEERLSAVQEEQASLRLERESLRQKLEKGQELLKKYETELKNIKLQKEKQDKILKKQSIATAQWTQTSPLHRTAQGTQSKSVRAPQIPIYSNSLFDLKMSKVEESGFGKPEDGVEKRDNDQSSKGDDAGLHELYLREYKLQLHLQEQQLEIQRQQVLLQQHLHVLQQQQQQQPQQVQQQQQQQQQQPQQVHQQKQQQQQQQQPQQVQQQQQQQPQQVHHQKQQQQQQQQPQQVQQQQQQNHQQQQHEQQQQQQQQRQQNHQQQQWQQHEQQQQQQHHHHHQHELPQTLETSVQQTDTPQQRPNHNTQYMKTQERLPDHHSQQQSESNKLQHSIAEHEIHQRSDKIQHSSHYNHLNNQPRKHLSHSFQAMDGLPSQQHHKGSKHGNTSQPVSQKTKTFERTRQYNSIGHDDVTDEHHKSFEKYGHPRKHSTEHQQPVEQHRSTEYYHTRPHSHLVDHHCHSPEHRHSVEKRDAREKHYHSNPDHPYQSEPHSPQANPRPEYYGPSEQNGSRRNHYHQMDDHHSNVEHFPVKPYSPQSENPVEPFSNKDYCQECSGNSKFLGEQHYAYSEHSCYIKQNHSPSEKHFFVVEQPKTVKEHYHHVASDPHTLHPSQHHQQSAYHNTPEYQLMREQPMTQYSGQTNSSHHQLPENRHQNLKHGSYGMDVLGDSSGHVHQTRQIRSHSNHKGEPWQPQINNGYSDSQASLDEYISNHHIPTEYDHHNHAGYALYKPANPHRHHERPHSRQKPSSAPNHIHDPYSQSPSNNYPHSLIEIVENLESNSEYEETFSDSHLTSEVVSVSSEEEENEVLDNIFFLKR